MINPVITVLMPVYNAEKFLREAINSVLDQSRSDFEFLIIDDGSTDSSAEIIRTYDDPRISFVQLQNNRGLIATLNAGLDMAKGTYIARMDADDICHRDRLAMQLEFMENHEEIAVCGTWFQMSPSGQVVRHPSGDAEIRSAMLSYCALGHPTTMLRASVLAEMSLRYNESYPAAEDYELWTQIVPKGSLANLPHVLLQYREHEGQVSAQMQAAQLLHAGRCRVNMLCKPLSSVTEQDKFYASLALGLGQILSVSTLNQVLPWLEKLSAANKHTRVFKDFDPYLTSRRAALISFFFHSGIRHYNPAVFYEFLKLYRKYKPDISLTAQLRLLLKCFSFYRQNLIPHV
jgi:glycosyltransferase involved in cell wall biosynthesis